MRTELDRRALVNLLISGGLAAVTFAAYAFVGGIWPDPEALFDLLHGACDRLGRACGG